MKIAYFDCFAGASGDMILGALVDAGLDPDLLNRELAKLHLDHFALSFKPAVKRGTRRLPGCRRHRHPYASSAQGSSGYPQPD